MEKFQPRGPVVDFLSAALEYVRHWPWLVLPLAWITEAGVCGCNQGAGCKRPGKHPLIKGGSHNASRDKAIIRSWWKNWPLANIGILTGWLSGPFVLDVDPRNGGSESLAKLIAQYGELPETLSCQTGGGGWHFYFRYTSPARFRGKREDYPGLDVKWDGGYVVAPPSLHYSGGVYSFQTDWRSTTLAAVPEWLLELIRVDESPKGPPRPKVKQIVPLPAWAEVEASPEDWDILGGLEAGKAGRQYQLLAEGDWRAAGYPTQSEADLAFFNKLARLTNGDAGRMYAICKETGLMRDHDDKPFSYYQRTIQKAIDGLNWRPSQGSTVGRCRR